MSSIDAAALAPVHRRVWQNNRPRRPPPMTSSTGNRSDGHGLCHGLDSAPAPRMSAPTQSHAPTCARAARGRAGRAIFIIRTHGNSCCRVRVAHPGHKPSLFAAHERECRMLTALVSDRRSSSSAARTLFRRCSTPSCIGRFKFSSHSHIDRPSTHYDTFTHAFRRYVQPVSVVFSLLPIASMMPMWFLNHFLAMGYLFCESGERYATVLLF